MRMMVQKITNCLDLDLSIFEYTVFPPITQERVIVQLHEYGLLYDDRFAIWVTLVIVLHN